MFNKLLYPPKVIRYNENDEQELVDYDIYQETMKTKKVGDCVTHHMGAPGYGTITYKITRMDTTGVYGYRLVDNSGILTPWMVR